MILMAVPLLGLFELSILFTRIVERQRIREARREEEAAEAKARAAEAATKALPPSDAS